MALDGSTIAERKRKREEEKKALKSANKKAKNEVFERTFGGKNALSEQDNDASEAGAGKKKKKKKKNKKTDEGAEAGAATGAASPGKKSNNKELAQALRDIAKAQKKWKSIDVDAEDTKALQRANSLQAHIKSLQTKAASLREEAGEAPKQGKEAQEEVDRAEEEEEAEEQAVAAHSGGGGGGKIVYNFDADEADCCETPAVAYRHMAPVLRRIAEELGKSPSELRIYDPYYCAGAVISNLNQLGFASVYNQNEDFYAMIEQGTCPEFDVVVTNPPYSGFMGHEHLQRLVEYCLMMGKPWFMLVPNWVYLKPYYTEALEKAAVQPCYLVPAERYSYMTPAGVLDAHGNIRKSSERSTSPFPSFWYGDLVGLKDAILAWYTKEASKEEREGAFLVGDAKDIPQNHMDAEDANRKRLNWKETLAARKTHTADGKKLCRQCGQVFGVCKHTKNIKVNEKKKKPEKKKAA